MRGSFSREEVDNKRYQHYVSAPVVQSGTIINDIAGIINIIVVKRKPSVQDHPIRFLSLDGKKV